MVENEPERRWVEQYSKGLIKTLGPAAENSMQKETRDYREQTKCEPRNVLKAH